MFTFTRPSPLVATMAEKDIETLNADKAYHETFFDTHSLSSTERASDVHIEEIRTTPLFSGEVLTSLLSQQPELSGTASGILPQYGLFAKVIEIFDTGKKSEANDLLDVGPGDLVNAFGERIANGNPTAVIETKDKRLFVNFNTPWSTFICGSQGSGKSHSLSCMLENALLPSRLGKLPRPLAGMVFHYDKFTGFSSTQICEAAYLASEGITVNILVSPTNLGRMTKAYRNLPGFPPNVRKPVVAPLLLNEKQLNVERMMKLMAVDEKDGRMALYMEVRSEAQVLSNLQGRAFCTGYDELLISYSQSAGSYDQ